MVESLDEQLLRCYCEQVEEAHGECSPHNLRALGSQGMKGCLLG